MGIQLGEYLIKYEIVRKNNKNIYFRFNDAGILVVSCNKLVSKKEIERLIIKNEKALIKMYGAYLKQVDANKMYRYLGEEYTVVYDSKVLKTYIDEDIIYTKDRKSLEKWEKEECVRIFNERIDEWLDKFLGIPQFSLRIRKMKTRWGVNNVTRKMITLNSELLKRDVTLIDYVVVHELCHFYEANHGKNFWYQVGTRYPDYKLARKRLRVE